ncbi:hypothetical protein VTO42DRAFT_2122 [Malbranchea cinnamomea]
MLLPSALSCESRQHSTRSRFAGAGRLFSSTPPPSDDSFIAGNGLLGTCRALQSLLNASPASSPRRAKPDRLQSPLQIRPHPNTRSQRVVKPAARPPRGINKRRRDVYEDESDAECASGLRDGFTTPKRRRRMPMEMPFGLEASDFRSLETPQQQQQQQPQHQSPPRLRRSPRNHSSRQSSPDSGNETQEDPAATNSSSEWTSEDDRRLVQLVLEKLKLSKRDWNDCARKMGKDHDTVGKRWKALVGEGNVGLRSGGRRIARSRGAESWKR